MVNLNEVGALLTGGKPENVEGFWGIRRQKLIFSEFLSYPYTLASNQSLTPKTLKLIKSLYRRGEIALTYPTPLASLSFPSPIIRGMPKYHPERRRLIRRAEERVTVVEPAFDGFYDLYRKTLLSHGRKPIPYKNFKKLYGMIDKIGIDSGGELVGALTCLPLDDRYLIWQIGWRREFPFAPTYLLHLAIERGLSMGYDIVDLGISPSPKSMKIKVEMGGDPARNIFVVRWKKFF
ncbi:MAG: GNAT family N-acetyltransferase [Thermotogae bacterium]|nr:GNAT family N-acetyltransferase [Thermotogota bacterium]